MNTKSEISPKVRFCYCSKTVRLLHAAAETLYDSASAVECGRSISKEAESEHGYCGSGKQGDKDASCLLISEP